MNFGILAMVRKKSKELRNGRKMIQNDTRWANEMYKKKQQKCTNIS